jgi:chitin-binding protein
MTATTAQKPSVEKVVLPGGAKHGYVTTPASRAYWCAQNKPGSNCGAIMYEPQSVEGPKGFPEVGPPDGQLASGGHGKFAQLDSPNAPDGKPWRATAVTAGAPFRFRWWLTQPHRTARWHYWITKDGWDTEKPLTRDSLELMAEIDWGCPNNEAWRCNVPIADVHHFVYLPSPKSGRHVILGIWDVSDTGNAFYQAVDVDFSAARDSADDVEATVG